LTDAQIDALLECGLLERTGLESDPLYKFGFDPVSEYLAALDLVIRLRDGGMLPNELSQPLPQSFRDALIQCANHLGVTLSPPHESNERAAALS